MTRVAAIALALMVGACASPSDGNARSEAPATASSSAYGNYLAGQFARSQGDTKTAAEFFARAVKQDPGSLFLLQNALATDLIQGDFAPAQDVARRIIAKDPKQTLANFFLGVVALKENQTAAALKHLQAVPPVGLDSLSAPMLIAWAQAGAGDVQAAIAGLQPLAGVPAFDPLRHFHSALIEDLAGNAAQADAAYRATLETGGQSAEVVAAYGNFLERHGRKDAARALFKKFLSGEPQSPGILAALRIANTPTTPKPIIGSAAAGAAEALYGIAAITEADTSPGIAILYLRLAIYLRPQFTLAHLLLADIYENAGQWRHAIDAYRGVARSSPYRWGADLRIAWSLSQLHETDQAIALLHKLAAEEPDRTEALSTLGDILRTEDKFEPAIAAYTEAIARLKPVKPSDWSLFYVRGIAYERAQDWPKAEADFLHALQLDPNQPFVLNYLGYSWIEHGTHLAEAQHMIERAVELAPDDGAIVDSLGWAYYHLHKYAQAVKTLERAVSLSPEDPTINDHLGDAYWRVGRHEEARHQWERVLTLKPKPEEIPVLKRKIAVGLGDHAGLDRRRAARAGRSAS